jgi:hypothetical protein
VSRSEESTTRWAVLRALLLVGACGGIGALVLPYGFTYLVIAGWTGGGAAALGAAVLFVAVVAALLVGVAFVVPEASGLTGTNGGRVGWALVVTVLGTVIWCLGLAVYTEAEPELYRNAMMGFPLSAVPYALVSGLLLRQWYFKLGAVTLVVASGVGLLSVLAGTVPDELEARLEAANIDRGTVFVAGIPGYHRVPQPGSWMLEPDDPQSVPANRYISLYSYPDDPTGDCRPNPHDTVVPVSPCTVERPGLTYTRGVVEHEYFYRKGTVLLRIVGPHAVDRKVLREAILTARPTDDPGVYTADVDGYESQPGSGSDTEFTPKDKTQVPLAKHVEVSASPVPHAGECAAFQRSGVVSPYLECVDESPDLHYQRMADEHLYLAQHGATEVRVMGGLGVDRNLLRDAAVSARPATDAELMIILPPAPPTQRTFMDGLKEFAKHLFG